MPIDRGAHTLLLYADERSLLTELTTFIAEGLESEETVVVIGTEDHRAELRRRLLAQQMIGLSAPWDHRYFTFDAADTLGLFLVEGWPEERLFLTAMEHFLKSIAAPGPILIYSEMMAVLWDERNYQAALHLEELWNTFAEQRQFTLLCGYSASSLDEVDSYCVQHLHRIHTERALGPGAR